LIVPMTAGMGEYPPELAAFQPQGGSRILAVARYATKMPDAGEIGEDGEYIGPTHPPLPGGETSRPINPPSAEPGLVEISLVTGKIRDVPR
jgi:hypothetical protein